MTADAAREWMSDLPMDALHQEEDQAILAHQESLLRWVWRLREGGGRVEEVQALVALRGVDGEEVDERGRLDVRDAGGEEGEDGALYIEREEEEMTARLQWIGSH
jgi:hypothetical protein